MYGCTLTSIFQNQWGLLVKGFLHRSGQQTHVLKTYLQGHLLPYLSARVP